MALPLLCAAAAIALSSCDGRDERATALTGGDPERGRAIIRRYGCPACHEIPGVVGAYGLVGPTLDGIAARVYIGGAMKNTPENMIRWIRTPRHIDPRTAMPELGVSERDARDIAGYLYTLE